MRQQTVETIEVNTDYRPCDKTAPEVVPASNETGSLLAN